MLTKRIIACLDVNAGRVVKGVQFVDLRDAGDPAELAKVHSDSGADEIVLLDISAAHERRATLLDTMRNAIYGPREVELKYGVTPTQMRDYLALVGDSSDNVPGVPSVGPKTATQLLHEHGDLDRLYAAIETVERKALRQKLEGMVLITVHPQSVALALLNAVDLVLAVGESPEQTIGDFCEAVGESPPERIESMGRAFLRGYRRGRSVAAGDLAAIPAFVAVRQIWLIGLHLGLADRFGANWLNERYYDRQLKILRGWEESFLSRPAVAWLEL